MSDFCEFQKPCSHKSNGRNLPGCFCPLPDLPAQHHLFLHDGKEFLRGTPDPGCSMEIANVKCLAGVLLLPHAGCYERDDSVVALVAPAGESPVQGLISKDAPLHPVQSSTGNKMPGISLRIHSRPIATMSSTRRKDHRQHSTMECILSFVIPQEPGFSPELLKKAGVSTAVCAHVGMARGLVRALYGPPVSGWESAFRGCSGKR